MDAGYLYAQGSALLKGKRLDRNSIRLSEKKALDQLTETACTVASDARLLRIYWYDGVLRSNRPSLEQDLIAQSANTKLRLGLINSRGQQKGVDSLIVTDLIELARNRAITDALILSGDEDVKIGVQVAQTFGVRIHLLGIKPAKGSQSDGLMMEADTCHEWDETVVGRWMRCDDPTADFPVQSASVIPGTDNLLAADRRPSASEPLSTSGEFQGTVAVEVKHLIETLSAADLARHAQFIDTNPGRIHSDIDRRTLASLRHRLGRDLTNTERRDYRQAFAEALRHAYDDADRRE